MTNIIHFKYVFYQKGAFFDSLSIHLRIDSLSLHVCTLKSSQFIFLPQQHQHRAKIGIRIKLPISDQKFQLVFHPAIINMITSQQVYLISNPTSTGNLKIDIQSELGQFTCFFALQEQKVIPKFKQCSLSSPNQSQISDQDGESEQTKERLTENQQRIQISKLKKQNKCKMDLQETIKAPRQWIVDESSGKR